MDFKEVQRFAKNINAEAFEVSAATGKNVADVFTKVPHDLLQPCLYFLMIFAAVSVFLELTWSGRCVSLSTMIDPLWSAGCAD